LKNKKREAGLKKRQYHHMPVQVLNEVADAMTEGADKYGTYNWRWEKLHYSDYYSAALRHLMAFYGGEDCDQDSGLSHITKAIAGLIILRDAMLNDSVIDDRYEAITRLDT
jgi:hypothetical protein